MTEAEPIRSEKTDRKTNLLIGLATSLAIHLGSFGLWFVFGIALAAAHLAEKERLKELQSAQSQGSQEPSLVFIEVTPEQAVPEQPKEAPFYSTANARAANPEPQIDTTAPKIDGSQDKVPKTVDTPRPRAEPLQPSPPPPDPEPEKVLTKPEKTSDATEKPGDLALARPKPVEPPKPDRRRTLAEARARLGIVAGEKMKQDGGVRRRGIVSVEAKATPYGNYDRMLIEAIQSRWYHLLDESNFPPHSGKVVIEFRIYSDGRITDLKVSEQDVGDILTVFCRRAISDPAPYNPWPENMRRMLGKEYRDVKFTFYYL